MQKVGWISAFLLLTGCSSMPRVSVTYFLPNTALEVKVTQTGLCTSGKIPILTTDVSFNSIFAAGASRKFEYGELGWGLSKTNATLEFYADGRLKSVNATQTGQVSEALASILSLAELSLLDFDPSAAATSCNHLKNLVGEGKSLAIIYNGFTDFTGNGTIELTQLNISDDDLLMLRPIFGEVSAKFVLTAPDTQPSTIGYKGPTLKLREPAKAQLDVNVVRNNKSATTRSHTWVGQLGEDYSLPLQKSPWFGENTMELTLSEAGRITKLKYGGGGTVAGGLAALDSIAKFQDGPSAADKVAKLKAEADLIYQQQRLIACQADPNNCVK